MDHQDLALEQRVWQRVSGMECPAEKDTEQLRQLQLRAEEASAAYRHLAQGRTGRQREKLMQLHREAGEDALALGGMAKLSGAGHRVRSSHPVGWENPSHLLAACCRRSRELEREYSVLRAHQEYGCVFDHLTQREQEHLRTLLTLIGEE